MNKAIALAAALFLLPGIAGAQSFSAILNGGQETPAVATPASGSGSFTLDGAKMLSYNISFSGLLGSETVAHIHCCAQPGTPAGPLFTLPAGDHAAFWDGIRADGRSAAGGAYFLRFTGGRYTDVQKLTLVR